MAEPPFEDLESRVKALEEAQDEPDGPDRAA
jgi:hypothetical protein